MIILRNNTIRTTISALLIIFLFLVEGCQDPQQQDSPPQTTSSTPQEEQQSPEQESLTREDKILYLADLMKNKRFSVSTAYQAKLREEPDQWLRYTNALHGKNNSIFHHPIWGIANNLVFEDLQIEPHMRLNYSLGLFTQECQKSSDGVMFKLFIRDHEGEHAIFEESFNPGDSWYDYSLDLSQYTGKTVTLELATTPLQDTLCDWAVWGAPRLTNYAIAREYETKPLHSAERFEAISPTLFDIPVHETGSQRCDRGWIANAVTTDIELAEVSPETMIRNELYVLDISDTPGEELVIEVLAQNEEVLSTATYPISSRHQVIVSEYPVNTHEKRPERIRIRLHGDTPSVVFIKEPVLYTEQAAAVGQRKPHVLLISLDTLRGDRLGCYGYQRNVSPNIDAFAKEAFVFTNAYSNSNWTLPAHTSMFTSLYPSQHQIVLNSWHNGIFQPYENPHYFITEAFQKANYLTLAFTGGGYVDAQYGFNKGFDYHIENIREFNQQSLESIERWLELHKTIPMFVFLHTYEVHDYHFEKPNHYKFVQKNFQLDEGTKLFPLLRLRAVSAIDTPEYQDILNRLMPEETIQYASDLYDGAIYYVDIQLGKLFRALQKMDIYDNSWIILTSDHGEGFGEVHNHNRNSSWKHGKTLYDDQIKIPLIIKPPKNFMQGVTQQTIDQFVQTLDIPPTLMEILEVSPIEEFQGANLLPLLTTPTKAEAETIKFSDDIRNMLFAVIYKEYKLIAKPQTNLLLIGDFQYELYHLVTDRYEKLNLKQSHKHVPIYNELKQLLDEHIQDFFNNNNKRMIIETTFPGRLSPESKSEDIDSQHLQRLKDLGYL